MEMCHKLPGANVDDVTNALKLANVRVISDQYLSGGMGDGGGCHPSNLAPHVYGGSAGDGALVVAQVKYLDDNQDIAVVGSNFQTEAPPAFYGSWNNSLIKLSNSYTISSNFFYI